jgi:hypothetical protein
LKVQLISFLFRHYLYFLENSRIDWPCLLFASIGKLVFCLFSKLNRRSAFTDAAFQDPHLSIFFDASDSFLSQSLSLYSRLFGRDCLSAKCSNFKHSWFVSLSFVFVWFDRGIGFLDWSICRRTSWVMIGRREDEIVGGIEWHFLFVGKRSYHLLGIVKRNMNYIVNYGMFFNSNSLSLTEYRCWI